VEDVTDAELMAEVVRELYLDEPLPDGAGRRCRPKPRRSKRGWQTDGGRGWNCGCPSGAKRRLMETTTVNAREAFGRHRLKRQSDHNARARALRSLQEVLGLEEAPLRIEAYDISTLQGTNTVASMVVMEDAVPKRNEYRRFKIRTVDGQDDFASMEETLRRRFTAYLREMRKPARGTGAVLLPAVADPHRRRTRAAGAGREGARRVGPRHPRHRPRQADGRGLPARPTRPDPHPRDAEALYLLQQIRDEAHRFAITYHRTLRSKSMVDSILDEVPGVGPGRKKALIGRYGSVKKMREATVEELAEVVPLGLQAAPAEWGTPGCGFGHPCWFLPCRSAPIEPGGKTPILFPPQPGGARRSGEVATTQGGVTGGGRSGGGGGFQ
jgi:excinuclease UvrABC nuclease subunit